MLTAFSWDFASIAAFRFITGFGIGALLGILILFARAFIPESPRWLAIHGHHERAERAMAEIETRVLRRSGIALALASETLSIHPRRSFGLRIIFATLFHRYRRRAVLCFVLIASQAFLYNAIFFTYALVLTRFYAVPAQHTGLYLLPFALGNFLGPLLMGHYFDSLGRRAMISATYAAAATLLVATGALFVAGVLSAAGQTAAWAVIFFFASAAASSAYLTISEVFLLELRALAIAVFYAFGTAAGGIVAPWLFGLLIGGGEGMIDAFALWPLQAGFMPWQLVSHAFLHGSAAHLAFNMLGLWMFGRELEYRLGPKPACYRPASRNGWSSW